MDASAEPSVVGHVRGGRIHQRREHSARVPAGVQGLEEDIAVAGRARGGGVGRVSKEHRTAVLGGLGYGVFDRHEVGLHEGAAFPEVGGEVESLAAGEVRVGIGHDNGLRAQLGHIGERIADQHAGREDVGLLL